MKDTYQHKGKRRQLVDLLRRQGISDLTVLKAMETIPRHWFMPETFIDDAYENKAMPIGKNQTISQPYTVAYQTMLLQVQARQKVLEVGTGSGYQAAILSALGARVFTLERQPELFQLVKKRLKNLGFAGIRVYLRDGFEGLKEQAPFDRIIVTAGAKEVPEKLLSQLKINGIMVIPVGKGNTQVMLRITRISESEYKQESFENFRFVPFLPGIAE